MKKIILTSAAALTLAGCAPELHSSLPVYMASKNLPAVTVEAFPHCEGYGCPFHKTVILSNHDWKKIDRAFGKKAKNADEERVKISKTIGVFEEIVGKLTAPMSTAKAPLSKPAPASLIALMKARIPPSICSYWNKEA
jgi:hypothetical protein